MYVCLSQESDPVDVEFGDGEDILFALRKQAGYVRKVHQLSRSVSKDQLPQDNLSENKVYIVKIL